ncbi:hypothetical protein LUZ63_012004 [Rhynchospora breviuscula]|uniref:RING-type domain-containing protein n=1 Tax=Rhynchospora breviuscula TaxID=2022672 RepID=A0A9Q0HQZ8_9POAL|nr:hypothetical protein LUZ63_012004 [Rhynchospora breviuscula]
MDHHSTTTSSSFFSSPSDSLMAAILSHPPRSFSSLISSLSTDHRFIRSRLVFLLLSPPHFSLALSRLHSLSLSQKSLLLARLLLHYLNLLLLSPSPSHRLRLLDFDAAVLLMAMCDSYSPDTSPSPVNWNSTITTHLLTSLLSPSGLGSTSWPVVSHYIDTASKCRRFLHVVSGGTTKSDGEMAASSAAVVSLPSVEIAGESGECVVCKEEMEPGRDVCELPCRHQFHWSCALRWLGRKNTCPCCRFELPTEDVYGEMGRLWRKMMSMGGGG